MTLVHLFQFRSHEKNAFPESKDGCNINFQFIFCPSAKLKNTLSLKVQCQYKGKKVRKKGDTFSVVSEALLEGGKTCETMETFKFCLYMYAGCL